MEFDFLDFLLFLHCSALTASLNPILPQTRVLFYHHDSVLRDKTLGELGEKSRYNSIVQKLVKTHLLADPQTNH